MMKSPIRSIRRLAAVAVIVPVAFACSSSDPVAPEPITELPRPLTSVERHIIENANTFGLDLFQRVYATGPAPNVVLSPLSASFALGMTLNGAAGDTWDGMRTGLHLDGVTQEQINEGYASLIELLIGLDPHVEFRIANSVWTRLGFPVLPTFYDAVQAYFDAEAQELDFDSQEALHTINDWVSDATNGRIDSAIKQISGADLMFLINAIYFDGAWTQQFDPEDTRADFFTRADGTTVPVQMMNRTVDAPFAQTQTYQAIELDYGGGAFSMVVVVPRPGIDVAEIVPDLGPARWAALDASLTAAEIPLSLPKLSVRFDAYLNDPLIDMGMQTAFSPLADFSNLTPRQVCIQFVRQKTFLEVDEVGTEAAAVTVVGIGTTSAPPSVRADRPFLFAIRERLSGTILFLGVIGDPSLEEAPETQKPDPPC